MGYLSHAFLLLLMLTAICGVLVLSRLLQLSGHSMSLDWRVMSSSSLVSMTRYENGGLSNRISSASVNGKQTTMLSKCDSNKLQILKVYMYDLPSVFHFGLLGWRGDKSNVWPDIRVERPEYAGGLNLQHSIEYWLTLDLLNSEFSKNLTSRAAVRVTGEVSNLLTSHELWKRSGGRDHIIVAHHPNSLLEARLKLWPAIFILADFGRYPPTVANVDKDIIAPYKHLVHSYVDDNSDFDSRYILLYFQGAIYRKDGGRIRQELFYLLKNEQDVHFSFGNIQGDGINKASEGMHSSKFCLNIAGDTPSSNRFFDAIASHCVPVVISDDIELPFEDIIDYSEFCIFVSSSDALKEKYLIELIRNIGKDKWTRMWRRLKEVEHLFEFHYPSQQNDAVQMTWQAISRKLPEITRKIHKTSRLPLHREHLNSTLLPRNFW